MIQAKKMPIKISMIHKGMNQKDLASKIKISESALSNFLNGKYSISPSKANLICVVLNKEFNELFTIKEVN